MLTLMRTRVPAARDYNEALIALETRTSLKVFAEMGKLPSKLKRYEDELDMVEITVNRQRTLATMSKDMSRFAKLIRRLGFEILYDETGTGFLTSDNPVAYYDPGDPGIRRPYIENDKVELYFPLSPRHMLHGSTKLLRAGQVPHFKPIIDPRIARKLNRITARFAYRFAFAADRAHDALVLQHAEASPVLEARVVRKPREVQYHIGHNSARGRCFPNFVPRIAKTISTTRISMDSSARCDAAAPPGLYSSGKCLDDGGQRRHSARAKSGQEGSAEMKLVKTIIPVGEDLVSGLLLRPADARALYLFAHGAGAGMTHKSMSANAEGLAERGIATLRYQFLYMEKSAKRPDPPRLTHAVVRAAAAQASLLAPDLPLFAGGRSYGGRMTSQTQAETPLAGVRGLALLGFPLHPAGKPGVERAEHLARVAVPMLFVTGARDALAQVDLLKSVIGALGGRATLRMIDHADHSFRVGAKSGRTSADAEAAALDALADWVRARV